MHTYVDYLGRGVRLTDERLAHIRSHPEMESAEAWIGDILAEPEQVIASLQDESVHPFYRFLPDTIVGAKWACVVVKSVSENPFVLTAYLTDKPKRGVVQWPKPESR